MSINIHLNAILSLFQCIHCEKKYTDIQVVVPVEMRKLHSLCFHFGNFTLNATWMSARIPKST